MKYLSRSETGLIAAVCLLLVVPAFAQDAAEPTPAFGFHAQATYIWQRKPSFNASYSGPKSLVPGAEKSYSFTTTADFGARLWQGAQLHFNPEGAQGVPLSNLTGSGGIRRTRSIRDGPARCPRRQIGRAHV